MRAIIVFVCFFTVWSFASKAKDLIPGEFTGFVKIPNGDELYVRVIQGDSNLEPIVFLNGLTQDTTHWESLIDTLKTSGRTLVFYDNIRQGRSLARDIDRDRLDPANWARPFTDVANPYEFYFSQGKPWFSKVDIAGQADEIKELLKTFGINKPCFVVGLSYGGGLALQFGASHPEATAGLVLVDPFVKPLPQQDQMIKSLITQTRLMLPLLPVSDDDLYDYFLLNLVLTTYQLSEPSILKWDPLQPFAAFSLVQGIRKLDSAALATKLKTLVHLVIAENDQYIPNTDLTDFWKELPHGAQGSLLKIAGVEHKVNESVGPFLAWYINQVAANDAKLTAGDSFEYVPSSGQLKDQDTGAITQLPVIQPCEIALLKPFPPLVPNLPIDHIDRSQSWWPSFQQTWIDRLSDFFSLTASSL